MEPALPPCAGPPVVWALLLILFVWISFLDENFLTPEGFLAYLKTPRRSPSSRSAPTSCSPPASSTSRSARWCGDRGRRREADRRPANTVPVIFVLFGIGLVVGIVNGFCTTILRVPSFIVTLAMLLILNGAVFLWTESAPVGDLRTTSAPSAARGSRASRCSRSCRTRRWC